MTRKFPIAAARPTVMKTVSVRPALQRGCRFSVTIVRTEQHDRPSTSEASFREPDLTAPDLSPGTGSAGNAKQMAYASLTCRRVVAAERRALARARSEPAPHAAASQPA
jgi:hypothetical protein